MEAIFTTGFNYIGLSAEVINDLRILSTFDSLDILYYPLIGEAWKVSLV